MNAPKHDLLPVVIDLDDLIMALSSRYELDDPSHYLDLRTGEVVYAGEGLDELPVGLKDPTRYRWIEPLEGEALFGMAEQFVNLLPPGAGRDGLSEALAQPEPLDAFVEAVAARPAERDRWTLYRHNALVEAAQAWCLAQGLAPQWA